MASSLILKDMKWTDFPSRKLIMEDVSEEQFYLERDMKMKQSRY
jgi:hypothetical protein